MDLPSPTTLILDLRDRMARIETKLDGHHEAHVIIDKAFELVSKRFEVCEAETAKLAESVSETRASIAIGRAKIATLATVGTAVGTAAVAVLTFLADHFWDVMSG